MVLGAEESVWFGLCFGVGEVKDWLLGNGEASEDSRKTLVIGDSGAIPQEGRTGRSKFTGLGIESWGWTCPCDI